MATSPGYALEILRCVAGPVERGAEAFRKVKRGAMPPVIPTGRDLRLDLFRGLALWLIFLDHIPSNMVAWITIRNYGFSDATEIFVFISGYTAAFVYGREMLNRGPVVAGAHILRRAWQVYVAHIFLFMIYMTELAYVTTHFENPLFSEEIDLLSSLKEPSSTLVQALLLTFQPPNLDILPLYIALLAGFPPVLWLLLRRPNLALGASVALYAATWKFELALVAYPRGEWFFNPLAWQLIFVFGAWCALGGAARLADVIRSRAAMALAIAYLAFSFAISLTWYSPTLDQRVPQWLSDFIYPVDKTNLDVLRFAHFLALATLTARFVRRDWAGLESPVFRPVIICGQHSLEIFCLGEFLSLGGYFVNIELAAGFGTQLAVSVSGILIMIATAALLDWYKNIEGRARGGRAAPVTGDAASGQPARPARLSSDRET